MGLSSLLKRTFWQWLALIVVLAIITRFVHLDKLPPLLLQDEASIGFNAISIAETGKDEWGTRFPLAFLAFGDNKQPIYIYATSLTYLITGWQPELPRIPSAVAGAVSVVLVALLTKKMLQSERVALFSALIMAVSPWAIHLSRLALEANLALSFFLGGLTLLAYTPKKRRFLWLLGAGGCFALSAYTYIAYRFIVAILLFFYAAFQSFQLYGIKDLALKRRMTLNSFIVLVVTGILLLPSVTLAGNFTRYSQTALVTSEKVAAHLHLYGGTCFLMGNEFQFPLLNAVCKVVWNAKTLPLEMIGQNLLKHVSPDFLFVTGDTTFNRNPTQAGMLYWFLLPLYLIGLFVALKNYQRYMLVLLGWFISLLPSVLTGEPHFIRLSAHLPFVLLLIALGIQWSLEKYQATRFVLILLLIASFGVFTLKYSLSVFGTSQEFLAHTQEASTAAYKYWKQGRTVYFDLHLIPEPQTYIAYWNNMDPNEYQQLVSEVLRDNQGFVRPAKLGDSLLFEEGDYKKVFCDPSSSNVVFISHHNPTPFKPTHIIYNDTQVHQLAFIYEIEDMHTQATASALFCQPDMPISSLQ